MSSFEKNEIFYYPCKVIGPQKSKTFEELFYGFDEIKIASFSGSLQFLDRIESHYKKIEVIFGCPNLLDKNLSLFLASKRRTFIELRYNEKLLNRLRDESFIAYFSNDIKNHSKLYLLSSEDRFRVISCSANASIKAWDGSQLESYTVFDDRESYERFNSDFEIWKSYCSETDVETIINVSEKDIREALPELAKDNISERKHIGILVEETSPNDPDLAFITSIEEDVQKIELDASKIETCVEDGVRILKPKSVESFVFRTVRKYQLQERPKGFETNFLIDYNRGKFFLNDEEFDLESNEKDVKKDLSLTGEWFNGMQNLLLDEDLTLTAVQEEFFKELIFMFTAPFIAMLRFKAVEHDFSALIFPMFLFNVGVSNNGKSAFANFVLRLMFGIENINVEKSSFTPARWKGIAQDRFGVPLVIDDLSADLYSRNAESIIKDDGIHFFQQKKQNHPCLVINTNKTTAFDDSITKRSIIVRVDGEYDKKFLSQSDANCKKIKKQITTGLYREFLKRIFPIILDEIDAFDAEDLEAQTFDLFKEASSVLMQIYTDFNVPLPDYVHEYSLIEIFSANSDERLLRRQFMNDYKYNRTNLTFKRRENRLIWKLENRQIHNINRLFKSIPKTLFPQLSGNIITMKLDSAEDFFGIRFNKAFWKHIFH